MSSIANEWTPERIAQTLRSLRQITTDKGLCDLYTAAADHIAGPELTVDLNRHTIVLDGHVIRLQPRETEIMEILRLSRLVSHNHLIGRLWGVNEDLEAPWRGLRVYISKINKKIAGTSYRIINHFSIGYELRRIDP